MNLLQLGNFVLNSGRKSKLKIECDALTDKDWEAAAYLAYKMLDRKIRWVEGIPRGGLIFAEKMKRYVNENDKDGCYLIVDDVFTTGGSMKRAYDLARSSGITNIRGVTLFARSSTSKYPWIQCVLQFNMSLWGQEL